MKKNNNNNNHELCSTQNGLVLDQVAENVLVKIVS